jgi:hypothetical protein
VAGGMTVGLVAVDLLAVGAGHIFDQVVALVVDLQDVVHTHYTSRHDPPPGSGQHNPASLPSPSRHVTPNPATHLSGPRRSLISSRSAEGTTPVSKFT